MIENYLLIIGSMKSGTTLLFHYLSQHPAIAPCSNKEPGFFAFDETYDRGFDWFEALFAFDTSRHKYAMDGSTDYTKAPYCSGVVERLAASAPRKFKLIYVMRNPLRRIESHAQHVQLSKMEVGRIVAERHDHSLDNGISDVSLHISEYADQIDHYRDYLYRGDLLLLTLEELSRDPVGTMETVYRFLGLEPVALPAEGEKVNVAENKRRLHPVFKAINGIPAVTALGRTLIPQSLRQRIKDMARVKATVKGRFKLTSEEEAELLKRYRPGLCRLRDQYGVDVERLWGIDLT